MFFRVAVHINCASSYKLSAVGLLLLRSIGGVKVSSGLKAGCLPEQVVVQDSAVACARSSSTHL